MGTYAVTGSASGMGYQAAQRLRDLGHTVIGVDIKDADVVADLSTPHGRRCAAEGVLSASGGTLHGAVLAAGIGPGPGRDRPRLIAEINFLGVVELLDAWRPALAAAAHGATITKVVVVASNSTTTMPGVPGRTVRALLARNTERAVSSVRFLGRASSAIMYAASKIAVSRWVRRQAITAGWAGQGIRLNAIAPGAVMTPLLQQQLAEPREAKAVRSFPIPVGAFGDAGRLADWITFMLSDSADFLCGSVIFVDGGSDAYFRADSWPRPVPHLRMPHYLWRFARYRKPR